MLKIDITVEKKIMALVPARADRYPTPMAKRPKTATELTESASIGRRLAEAREAIGLDQSELGRRLGVSQQQLSLYERGSSVLSAVLAGRVARIFSKTVWLASP